MDHALCDPRLFIDPASEGTARCILHGYDGLLGLVVFSRLLNVGHVDLDWANEVIALEKLADPHDSIGCSLHDRILDIEFNITRLFLFAFDGSQVSGHNLDRKWVPAV
jgi:hypothetical protein